ncbi:MAG: transglycosylase SLT domain-containing protein, partial [Myxococcota bacterium]
QIQLSRARVLEQLGQEAESLAAYRRVASAFSERPEAEQALYRAADLLLRARRYSEAKSSCQKLLVMNPLSRFRTRCLWDSAWADYRLGRFESAHRFFSTLMRAPLPPDLDAAGRYWLGRTEADLGRPQKAVEHWQQVLERHPLDYYAGLAERQLVVEPAAVTAPDNADETLPAPLAQAWEYQRLGLRDRALKAAADYEAIITKNAERPTAATYRALAGLYEASRRFRAARRVREQAARAYATGPGTEEFLAAARRAHPLKFEREVRRAAKEFNLAPSLLFALVRTESGFKQDAVSAMNAYGLAQLILPTAQSVARKIKAGRVTRKRLLTNPGLNVRLGAAYLRSLLDRYEGREPFAVAAYNAGPHAVDAWRRRRIRRLPGVKGRGVGLAPSPDEFAEEVPVEETQRFVKAVLSRARAYAVLYPDPETEEEAADVPVAPTPVAAALVEPARLPEAPKPQYALPPGVHYWIEDALNDSEHGVLGWR